MTIQIKDLNTKETILRFRIQLALKAKRCNQRRKDLPRAGNFCITKNVGDHWLARKAAWFQVAFNLMVSIWKKDL